MILQRSNSRWKKWTTTRLVFVTTSKKSFSSTCGGSGGAAVGLGALRACTTDTHRMPLWVDGTRAWRVIHLCDLPVSRGLHLLPLLLLLPNRRHALFVDALKVRVVRELVGQLLHVHHAVALRRERAY